MTDNQIINHASLEAALRLMEQTDELTAEEIGQLTADDACMAEARDLWRLKKAVDRQHATVPDADAEWERFAQRNVRKPRARIYIIGVAVAAAAAVLLLWLMPWSRTGGLTADDGEALVAYTANDEPRNITISSDKGASIVVNQQSVAALGQELTQTDGETVSYKNLDNNIVESHTITIPQGRAFKVVLADGSEVWLNAGSRLVYPTRFVGQTREVALEGEAYFRVRRDEAHPFVVNAGHTSTRVLGTEFDVCSYADAATRITLVQGSVACEVKSGPGKKGKEVRLTPGQQAVLASQSSASDAQFSIQEVDTDSYVYWRDGYFFFDNEPLENIMRQIGEWYNVSVVFINKDRRDTKMHVFCNRNESVEKALEQLNLLQKATFRMENGTIYVK